MILLCCGENLITYLVTFSTCSVLLIFLTIQFKCQVTKNGLIKIIIIIIIIIIIRIIRIIIIIIIAIILIIIIYSSLRRIKYNAMYKYKGIQNESIHNQIVHLELQRINYNKSLGPIT